MNKTTTPRITIGMLRGACKEQRDIFRKEWPEGAEVTIENVRRAQELGLDLSWGERWFTPLPLKAYAEAREHARKVYLEAISPARRVFRETIAPAQKAYRDATAQVWVVAYIASVAEREMQQ